jgi:hypothetical protein
MVSLPSGLSHDRLVAEWDRIAGLTKRQVSLPRIDESGATVTPGTAQILNDLLWKMTAVHYKDRVADSNTILRRVDSAMRIIENDLADKLKAKDREVRRGSRKQKEIARRERLAQYLAARH